MSQSPPKSTDDITYPSTTTTDPFIEYSRSLYEYTLSLWENAIKVTQQQHWAAMQLETNFPVLQSGAHMENQPNEQQILSDSEPAQTTALTGTGEESSIPSSKNPDDTTL